MIKMTKNVIKGIVTSIIGIITMIITLFLVFTGSMDFIWEGVIGLSIGTVLLLAPDTLVQKLGDLIKTIGFNKSGADAIKADQKIEDENNIGTQKTPEE